MTVQNGSSFDIKDDSSLALHLPIPEQNEAV